MLSITTYTIRLYYNIIIIIIIFLGEPNRGSFFIICSGSAVHVQSVYVGLTQQVHIGRGTTWQGCETNFLSLGPDVISLTSIRLTTEPIPELPGRGHHKHLRALCS